MMSLDDFTMFVICFNLKLRTNNNVCQQQIQRQVEFVGKKHTVRTPKNVDHIYPQKSPTIKTARLSNQWMDIFFLSK